MIWTTSQVSCLHTRGWTLILPHQSLAVGFSQEGGVGGIYYEALVILCACRQSCSIVPGPVPWRQSQMETMRGKAQKLGSDNILWVEDILWDLEGRIAGSSKIRKLCSPALARLVYSLKFSGSYFVCHSDRGSMLLLGVPWCLAYYFAHKIKAFRSPSNAESRSPPWDSLVSEKWPKSKKYTYSMSIC